MPPLSRDAILAVLSGLTVLACDKAPQVAAEPVTSAAPSAAPSPATVASPPAVSAAPASSATPAASLKEVAPAAGKPAEKEKTCVPGGCAPGQCGANK